VIAESRQLLTDNFLLVADEDGNRIIQVDTETMTDHKVTITVTSRPQVLAYDWLRREVYWTSGSHRNAIFKYSFASSTTYELYTDQATFSKTNCSFNFPSTFEKVIYISSKCCSCHGSVGR